MGTVLNRCRLEVDQALYDRSDYWFECVCVCVWGVQVGVGGFHHVTLPHINAVLLLLTLFPFQSY